MFSYQSGAQEEDVSLCPKGKNKSKSNIVKCEYCIRSVNKTADIPRLRWYQITGSLVDCPVPFEAISSGLSDVLLYIMQSKLARPQTKSGPVCIL